MLTNRPEFHFFDSAALHLGATPFSVYNTYTADQIQYQLADAGARIAVTERAFLDRLQAVEGLEHLVLVDGEGEEGTLTIADVEAAGDAGFDFDAAWRAVSRRTPSPSSTPRAPPGRRRAWKSPTRTRSRRCRASTR